VAFRGRHTQSHPQLPLATPEIDPEVVLRKGKAFEEEASTVEPSNPPSPSVGTPFSPPRFLNRPFSEVSRFLNFESVRAKFSPLGLGLEGEILVTPLFSEAILWRRPRTPEDFPTPIFTTRPPIIDATSTERVTFVPSSHVTVFPNIQLFPSSPRNSIPISHVHPLSPPVTTQVHVQMAGANPPRNRMAEILVAIYAPKQK